MNDDKNCKSCKMMGEISPSELDVVFTIRKCMRDLINYKESRQKVSFSINKNLCFYPDQGYKLIDF